MTLAGLAERHPARTIFLVPEPGRRTKVASAATVRDFDVEGLSREVVSEVIEIRLCGMARRHPGSIVLPLLLSDLPVFCRWRGEPVWESEALAEIVTVCERLVVDSSEWRGVPAGYAKLAELFERVAVSDIAFARTLPWRQSLAALWPGIAMVERLRVHGPRADAELLAGWLRSRLRRPVKLTRRHAETLTEVRVDGEPVTPVARDPLSASDLLSAELDQLGRDPVYEEAVRAAAAATRAARLLE
jgi:glucose-6-phosphate dehydrogenase assembly protein OpcA